MKPLNEPREGRWHCRRCGWRWDSDPAHIRYCPHCGGELSPDRCAHCKATNWERKARRHGRT